MREYNSQDFIARITQKALNMNTRKCPFCGGAKFTSTKQFAGILINNDMDNFFLGPSIPSGMIICENCGHIDFFALGYLGMLQGEDNAENEKYNN